MKTITRRTFLASTAAMAALCATGCGGTQAVSSAASASSTAASSAKHTIGVVVYNVSDNEVIMFKDYLVNYIAGTAFEDVRFIYSGSVTTEDQYLSFIDDVAALGGEGVLCFTNIDIEAEVNRCAEHGMYNIRASGTLSEEDFAKVEDNEFFLGCIGPGIEVEYNAGNAMVRSFVEKKEGRRFFVMSGGAPIGNEMHYQRTFGILDAIETGFGIDLGETKELAAADKAVAIELDDAIVVIAPGLVAREGMKEPVLEALCSGEFDVVLSSIPIEPIRNELGAAKVKIAQVDCYSQSNQLLFASRKLSYLVGKYGSIVGPSFAAMYNAVTGYVDDFRDNGKAFRIKQGFWSSDSPEDFDEKYQFASNITSPAYNYEDLQDVCKAFNPSATFEDLKKLAEASSFEDAKKRRSQG